MPTIRGTNRNDNLLGTSADDSIYALGGADIFDAGAGNDSRARSMEMTVAPLDLAMIMWPVGVAATA